MIPSYAVFILLLSQGFLELSLGTDVIIKDCSLTSKGECDTKKAAQPLFSSKKKVHYSKVAKIIEPKTNEEVLELIVKIAENPNTWKQIHRVLETLEANNAAYSKRIFSKLQKSKAKSLALHSEDVSSYRNTFPDDSASTKIAGQSLFNKWKESLRTFNLDHPQAMALQDLHDDDDSKNRNEPSRLAEEKLLESEAFPQKDDSTTFAKSFEDRLREIEVELSRLAKQNRPQRKLEARKTAAVLKPTLDKLHNATLEKKVRSATNKSTSRFSYHKVRKADEKPSHDFWRKTAVARQRNAVVVVSISPSKTNGANKTKFQVSRQSHKLEDNSSKESMKDPLRLKKHLFAAENQRRQKTRTETDQPTKRRGTST